MRIAFTLFKYYPYGGLERDFLKIALYCQSHGHDVDIYTMAWDGPTPDGITLHILPPQGFSNHARAKHFSDQFNRSHAGDYECVFGFNRMEGLDFYYAADVCFKETHHNKSQFLKSILPRYRVFSSLENQVFSPDSKTKIFVLVPKEQAKYQTAYQTQNERFTLLPPGINRQYCRPDNVEALRQSKRSALNMDEQTHFFLQVGSDFKRKGVERTLRAISSLSPSLRKQIVLGIIGKGDVNRYKRIAEEFGISDRVYFLGTCDDVHEWMWAADALIHPAVIETAGMVIVEAIVAGLPVLVSGISGYSSHVANSKAGIVLSDPFQQTEMNEALTQFCDDKLREQWQKYALGYAATTDLYSLPECILKVIENDKVCEEIS